jgi:uncharacterized membrane protein YidH (DUF202 family)
MNPSDDGGLQLERTILAWQRTTLTATVVALLAIRACIVRPSTAQLAIVVLSSLAICGAAAGTGLRTRHLGGRLDETRAAPKLFVAAVSATSSIGSLCVLLSLR